MAREATPPFRALDPLFASIAATATVLCGLGLANEGLMLNRGERNWNNWLSGEGSVHLEWFEPMMMLFYGGVLASAVLLTISMRREQKATGAIVGLMLLALASLFQFLRGRLHVPISPTYDWEGTQVVWALGFTVVAISGIVFAKRTGDAVEIAGLHGRDDLVGDLRALGRAVKSRAIGAIGLAMVVPLAIALGENIRSLEAHEDLSHVAGLAGIASFLLAIAGSSQLRARRFAIEEALRRE